MEIDRSVADEAAWLPALRRAHLPRTAETIFGGPITS
jgi:hypothetical protein